MTAELCPEDTGDVLATAGLYAESVLLGEDDDAVVADQEATVTFVRPLAYRLTDDTAGGLVHLLLCFPFDLSPLTGGRAYAEARLDVVLDDGDARALALEPGAGTVHEDGTRVAAFGRGGHQLRWVFGPPPGGLRPDGHWTQVLVRLPADRTEVAGRVSAQAAVRRTLLGRPVGKRASTREDVPFRIAVTDAWPVASPGPVLPYPMTLSPSPSAGPGAREAAEDQRLAALPWLRRLLLAVDVERYGRRPDNQMSRVQRDLWRAVRGACAASGIDWRHCGRQASGDGYLLVLPTGLDEPRTVAGLLRGLTLTLHNANTDPERPVGVLPTRIRASLHQGLIREGHSGFLGTAVVDLFRVLDSGALRAVLRDSAHADLAVAWSGPLYRDLVPHAFPGLDRRSFQRVRVEVPEKEFTSDAWIQLRPRPGLVTPPPDGTAGVPANPH